MGFPAARITDMHVCPMFTGPVPHVGGPILPPGGIPTLIGSLPAARMADMAVCVGPPDVIVKGSLTVLIGKKPAARMLDNCAHGGVIVAGFPTVLIGDAGMSIGGMPVVITPGGPITVGNNIIINGSPEFQARVLADLAVIANMPSSDPTRPAAGQTTLNNIDNGSNTVTIVESTSSNATNGFGADAQTPGVGSDSTVNFNPSREPPTAADPSVNRPADVGLHHELAHADSVSQGNLDLSPAANPNNPHVEEDRAIARDNQYRDDRGIPQRADHTVL